MFGHISNRTSTTVIQISSALSMVLGLVAGGNRWNGAAGVHPMGETVVFAPTALFVLVVIAAGLCLVVYGRTAEAALQLVVMLTPRSAVNWSLPSRRRDSWPQLCGGLHERMDGRGYRLAALPDEVAERPLTNADRALRLRRCLNVP